MRESEESRLSGLSMREGGGVDRSEDTPLSDDDPEEFDGVDEDAGPNIDKVVELSDRERCARSFAIRRAIEQRMEQKALHHDLDYLDCDLDD